MSDAERRPLNEMANDTRKIEAESGIGLACPKCGCRDTRVSTTWHTSDGMETKRTRVCRNCRQQLTTRETFF